MARTAVTVETSARAAEAGIAAPKEGGRREAAAEAARESARESAREAARETAREAAT